MNQDIKNTFKEKIYECDKHVEKIETAKQRLHEIFPLTKDVYSGIDEIQSSFIDQLVFRFSKLQDSMGEGIFPSVLILGAEDVKRKTFIDILNRLEELELVKAADWLTLREIRNDIAHEYSENTEEVVNSLNQIYKKSSNVIKTYELVKTFCKDNFGL